MVDRVHQSDALVLSTRRRAPIRATTASYSARHRLHSVSGKDYTMDKTVQKTFWEAFAESPFIMMRLDGSSGHAKPMTAQLDNDATHAIWFFTTRDNRIGRGGKAMGQMVSKDHQVFACLSGTLVEETDRSVWDRHWDSAAKAWFPEGRDDPNVTMLRFDIDDAEVWVADLTISGKLKLLTGSPISPHEAGNYAKGTV